MAPMATPSPATVPSGSTVRSSPSSTNSPNGSSSCDHSEWLRLPSWNRSLPPRRDTKPSRSMSMLSASRRATGRPFSLVGSLPSLARLLMPAGQGPTPCSPRSLTPAMSDAARGHAPPLPVPAHHVGGVAGAEVDDEAPQRRLGALRVVLLGVLLVVGAVEHPVHQVAVVLGRDFRLVVGLLEVVERPAVDAKLQRPGHRRRLPDSRLGGGVES